MNEQEKGQITMLGIIVAGVCLLLVLYFAPILSSLYTGNLSGNSFVDSMGKMILPIVLILLPLVFLILLTTR